tara:strand:- start:167 stop:1030 length:864 start_codon:yes stop_codon:yes gene_type:complete
MFFSILFLDAASVFGDKLRLVNGKSFDCTFISQTIQRETGNPISIIRIRLSDGTELDFRRSEVEFVQLDSGEIIMGSPTNIDKVDPLASRYLYAPSSFSLKKGEMYVSQKELFFTSVARGLTDNITILGGGVLPLLIAGDFFLISGGKISTRIRRNFRASAGFEVLSASDVNFGFMFGGGTYSGQNFHVSLIGGKPFAFGFGERELGPFLTVVGLNKKVTQRLRFVSETWFIPDIMEGSGKEKKTYWLSGNVIRFLINNSFALDSGFIFFEDGGGNSIPWIDFAYVF